MSQENPLSILFLTYQGDMAGSTQSISFLAKELASRGHTVVVGCRRESWLYGLLKETKVILEPMNFHGKLDRNNMRQIHDAVIKYGIQIINAQSSKDRYTAIFAKWLFGLQAKVVHTRRQMPLSSGGKLQALFYSKSTAGIIAVSLGVKRALIKTGIPADHIKVIFNGTPIEKYEDVSLAKRLRVRKKYNPDGLPMIGCVARLKEQAQILRAARSIETPLCIVFGGISADDMEADEIQHLPERHQLHLPGKLETNEALALTAAFDAYCLPSTMEGLSQSLLEAMALGVPVVATNAGGNPDLIVEGENGLLFEDGDISTLRDQLIRLLEDVKLRQKLIANGRKTALEKFSLERTTDQYESYFRELTED